MYHIYVDGNLLYSPSSTNHDYTLVSATMTPQGGNKAGSLTLTIPPTNPSWGAIQPITSILTVMQDTVKVFQGRVISSQRDVKNNLTVTVEGWLSVLLDSVVIPYNYAGSVRGYLQMLIDGHNAQCDSTKHLILGNVTVSDPNDYITRASSDYPTTWDELNKKCIDLLGGHIHLRWAGRRCYLDYLADYPVSGQIVVFGENLLDMDDIIEADELFTVLVPLGKKDEETETRLTVASVNDGSVFVEDAEKIALYGRIVRTMTWDDVTIASNLLSKAQKELEKAALVHSIRLTAFDRQMINPDVETLKPDMMTRIISAPHQIDAFAVSLPGQIDLLHPQQSIYDFGGTRRTLTGGAGSNVGIIENADTQYIINQPFTIKSTRAASGNLWGDVDGDGVIGQADLQLVAEYLAHMTDNLDFSAADLFGDGRVGNDDMTQLARLVADIQAGQIIQRSKTGDDITFELINVQ